MEAVLHDEYYRNIDTEEAVVCDIINKKDTSKIIRELNTKFPVTRWQHLKRVKANKDGPLQVLICPVGQKLAGITSLSLQTLFAGMDFDTDILSAPSVVNVPCNPPLTRPQFVEASKLWPTSFHEDKRISSLLKGDICTDAEMSKHKLNMEMAVQAARDGAAKGQLPIGCVVVDPQLNLQLVICHDQRQHHPLWHAVMVAVDLVAKQQGGGAYEFPGRDQHIAQLETLPSADDKTGPYLCTGYDLYVTQEPCSMCAMALVHSRIRRIFWGCQSEDGALGTRYKVHVEKSLNHHYEVYKSLLEAQCRELTNIAHTEADKG